MSSNTNIDRLRANTHPKLGIWNRPAVRQGLIFGISTATRLRFGLWNLPAVRQGFIFGISTTLLFFATSVSAQQTILQQDLSLKYLVRLPTQKTAHPPIIILLHGYGSDERDLFELRNFFPKNYIIISARAPYTLPHGGYQWYTMTQVGGIHDGNTAQLTNSRKLIEKFITEAATKYQADPKEVYLMGFSQGAIMSYQVGLTAPSMLRGIGVLSGTIYPSLKPLIKKTDALKQLKIFVSHGNVDEIIPFNEGKAAADYLTKLGLSPDFHRYAGMGHSISKDVLFDLVTWLKK